MKLPHLRQRRQRALLTQQQLAVRAALTRQTISEIEHGGDVRLETVRKLAAALRCKPEDLMELEPR